MKKTQKWFEEHYINGIKKEMGYDSESLNLSVMNNPSSFGKVMLFGALSSLSLRMYNLSIEEEGLLFIQRNVMNNELLTEKSNFIYHDEIQTIRFKKGILQDKLLILNKEGKKLHFKINKKIARVPWHKESLEKVQQMYA
ncbi:hypothetical protein [Enterococcus sp. BWR-S5]|uniref:hypothetical protein n=1 Tax=Enterococcus sp. BWR-S5 TaxID=2787714 RepID=UPI001921B5F4|nr:hypothetical protein [Enterococcus sp. BWR-S5]MBL1223535.1 hypothetical protein [Enterococcus sp. BWR-S5]